MCECQASTADVYNFSSLLVVMVQNVLRVQLAYLRITLCLFYLLKRDCMIFKCPDNILIFLRLLRRGPRSIVKEYDILH